MNLTKPLDERERDDLVRALDRGARTGGATFSQLDGLLCAITLAPTRVEPSFWLGGLFGDRGPLFASAQEAEQYLGLVMRHDNAVVAAIVAILKYFMAVAQLVRG